MAISCEESEETDGRSGADRYQRRRGIGFPDPAVLLASAAETRRRDVRRWGSGPRPRRGGTGGTPDRRGGPQWRADRRRHRRGALLTLRRAATARGGGDALG